MSNPIEDRLVFNFLNEEILAVRDEATRVRLHWDRALHDYWGLQEKYANQFQELVKLKQENGRLRKEIEMLEDELSKSKPI